MPKVNNKSPKTRCETCSKLTIETLEQGVKYVQVNKVSLLLTLNIFHTLF